MGDASQTGAVTLRNDLHGKPRSVVDATSLSSAVVYPVVPGRVLFSMPGLTLATTRRSLGATLASATVSVIDNTLNIIDRTKVYASFVSTSLDETIGDLIAGLTNDRITAGLTPDGHLFVQTALGSNADLKDILVDIDTNNAGPAASAWPFFGSGYTYATCDHGALYVVDQANVQCGNRKSLKDILSTDLAGIAYPFEIDGNVQFANGDATTLASLGIPAGTVMNIYGYDHDTAGDTPDNQTGYSTTLINVTATMSVGDLKTILTQNIWTVDTSNKTLKMMTTFAPYKRFVNVAAWSALLGTDFFGKALITANNAIPDTCYLPPPIVSLHNYIVGLAARVAALDHGSNP